MKELTKGIPGQGENLSGEDRKADQRRPYYLFRKMEKHPTGLSKLRWRREKRVGLRMKGILLGDPAVGGRTRHTK